MPFEAIGTFFAENVGDFSFNFDVGSLVDDFGTEFLTDIQNTFTDFNIPSFEVPSFGGWEQAGSFAGSGDWFDTFNVGKILDSVPSIGDFNLSSLTDNFPSLSSITDSAKSLGESLSTGFQSIKDALPSLDKIKDVASTFQKDIGSLAKTGQQALSAYQKVAPAVNAVSNALGIQNPITQFIQPLQTAVGLGGAAAGIAGGVSGGISSAQSLGQQASSFGQKVSDFFAPSPTEKAESYNQALRTVESTDSALKQYDSERATYTADIVRTSDNIYAIQSKLEDPDISEEEREVAQAQLKGEYDKLATTTQALEQTNTAEQAVITARDSAAKIVATTDANTIKLANAVETKQTITNYNQAVSTVDSTNKALKQYDADKAAATQDILRTSDNISTIQSKLDDPDTSPEERAVAEKQLQSQYDQLALAQKSLEQTNTAEQAVIAARDQAAQVVAGTNLNTIKTPFQVDQYGLVILDDKGTAQLEKNLNPAYVNSLADPAAARKSENYNQAKATIDSTNAALKQYDAERAAYTSDIVKTSDNIYNINQRLDNPNTSPEERALLEEQLQNEYARLAETKTALEQTNFVTEQVTAARDQAAQVIAGTDSSVLSQAAAVVTSGADQFKTAYDSLNKTWSVFDSRTGQTVQTGLSEQQAILAEQDLNISSGISLNSIATSVSAAAAGIVATGADAISSIRNLFTGPDGATAANSITSTLTNQARAQQTVRELRNTKAQSTDWRVRLKLAPNSNYLYNDPAPGILAALKLTDGVIFPYTPSIETAYKANYDAYDLTHSNYRGYFYKGSYVDAVNVRGTFTAQDTKEADYLLAVIHFFRSCTKMFYGKDTQRGAPPPLVYLNGYGDYQFAEHPCVVNQFNYTLPPDVDYIRCQSTLQNNTNRLNSRLRNPLANNPLAYSVNRLLNSSLVQGALTNSPLAPPGGLASSGPTYVPTKMEISITLLPIQSRSQISNNFSVKEFANGNLLKGGYW